MCLLSRGRVNTRVGVRVNTGVGVRVNTRGGVNEYGGVDLVFSIGKGKGK